MLYHMDFPLLLKKAIKKRGLSYAEFAEKVGVSHGLPGSIISKQRRNTPTHIPDGKAEEWADALGLVDAERAAFLKASAYHYASEDQKKVYTHLIDKVGSLKRKLDALVAGMNGGPTIAPKPHQPLPSTHQPQS